MDNVAIVVEEEFEDLRQWCEAGGTSYDNISRTILYSGSVLPDAAAFLEQMRRYADVWVHAVRVVPPADDPVGSVRGLGEHVVPALQGL